MEIDNENQQTLHPEVSDATLLNWTLETLLQHLTLTTEGSTWSPEEIGSIAEPRLADAVCTGQPADAEPVGVAEVVSQPSRRGGRKTRPAGCTFRRFRQLLVEAVRRIYGFRHQLRFPGEGLPEPLSSLAAS